MEMKTSSNNHTVVFSSLVVLALLSVGITLLHMPIMANNLAIFAVAVVMAGLVFFQYMDLKSEGKLIYWIMIIPFVLFGILLVLFIPDVCHFSIDFLKRVF
jgi:caa(3)-type oxidase subunit IV